MDQSFVLQVRDLSKDFTVHTQGGVKIAVFAGLDLDLEAGRCVALHGPSGCGKSTLLRSLYANYKPDAGQILIRHGEAVVDMVSAEPRIVLAVRRYTLGYVSQFLRVIPRVPAIDVVAEPAILAGIPLALAREKAASLLERLNVSRRLWDLAPATFSGGEQQRVNVARGFIVDYPVLLLDEPTASLDAGNRETVVQLMEEAKARGAGLVGIFHDKEIRDRIADRLFDLPRLQSAA
ncbi:phosphonate C-P lyase system protein PhnL [Telmatospirillum sp.]|uniref:phosphonate C-P lyase system protein PhnL n=1 Tax=Telmatospirillum sp. TaxID=2079197 RepID=UPI00284EA570|nr:phosphonate C-P lyase system protein PhnL [Telmatospirillum sp.]MDR3440874.1 phosphonate C-P lyase system protein PhnL [Telmatospirillum sp.]